MEDPNLIRQYKPAFVQFMSFIDNEQYNRDIQFTLEHLSTITPGDVVRWLKFKAFGTDTPEPGALPQGARANSLLQYKKSLSYFMPQQTVDWNPTAKIGNPTRSKEVRALIQFVKKKEVRNQGKESQARRPLVADEFRQTIVMLSNFNDPRKQYMIPACIKMQFHLIGRIDDSCHMLWSEVRQNPQFDYTLLVRMRWSKNVMEERDAPQQIVIGAKDSMYCVLLSLGIYGEVCSEAGVIRENSTFLFGHTDDAARNKSFISSTLSSVWASPEFDHRGGEEPIGSHSIRKFGTTKARQSGCSRDDVEDRARWRRQTRTSTRYTDVRLPYPDAKVAAALCVGGPIKYAVREGAPITQDWLFQFVIPNLVRVRGETLTQRVLWTLGLPVLWACFEASMVGYISEAIRQRVRASYASLDGADVLVNPVVRIELGVTGQESELHIAEIIADGELEGLAPGGEAGAGGRIPEMERFRITYSTIQNMKREILEKIVHVQLQEQRHYQQVCEKIRLVHIITRRLAMQPARRLVGGNVEAQGGGHNDEPELGAGPGQHLETLDPRARLSAHPRSLYDLWNEFEFGLGGNKPARQFTAAERGRCKHAYCRRKVVWDKLDALVRGGHTYQSACDLLRRVYGENLSVTRIILAMKEDKRNGVVRPELG